MASGIEPGASNHSLVQITSQERLHHVRNPGHAASKSEAINAKIKTDR